MQHPLWREEGSIVYNCCRFSPSQVRTPRDIWPYITVSDSGLPQPGGNRIYIPQEEDGPVIPPGTGFPFRRFLRLAGLINLIWTTTGLLLCNVGTDRQRKRLSISYPRKRLCITLRWTASKNLSTEAFFISLSTDTFITRTTYLRKRVRCNGFVSKNPSPRKRIRRTVP
jgi:hypothetical protein